MITATLPRKRGESTTLYKKAFLAAAGSQCREET